MSPQSTKNAAGTAPRRPRSAPALGALSGPLTPLGPEITRVHISAQETGSWGWIRARDSAGEWQGGFDTAVELYQRTPGLDLLMGLLSPPAAVGVSLDWPGPEQSALQLLGAQRLWIGGEALRPAGRSRTGRSRACLHLGRPAPAPAAGALTALEPKPVWSALRALQDALGDEGLELELSAARARLLGATLRLGAPHVPDAPRGLWWADPGLGEALFLDALGGTGAGAAWSALGLKNWATVQRLIRSGALHLTGLSTPAAPPGPREPHGVQWNTLGRLKVTVLSEQVFVSIQGQPSSRHRRWQQRAETVTAMRGWLRQLRRESRKQPVPGVTWHSTWAATEEE